MSAPTKSADPTITWIVTTEHDPWQSHDAPAFTAPAGLPDVFIDTSVRRQTIEGFGASFNELGFTALAHLPEGDRDEIMRTLFEPGAGANLTLCRMPVGANDFSREWYSYDETPGDLELEHFSIGNDLETLIPFIRQAKAHQPQLKLWASPWSPPSWMKTNGHYAAAQPRPDQVGVENGLTADQVGAEGTDMIRLDDANLAAYAEYFGRFIDAYREQGIDIGMVMPQNEFNSAQVFPSCTWTPEGLVRFLGHLVPAMDARGVEVFLGTLERPDPALAETVIDSEVGVVGVGVQWHGSGAVPFIHRSHPHLRIYQTEQECGDGRNDWRYARYVWSLMRHFFGNGANAYMYWNMALLEGGISRWGWAQNSLVVVDADARAARFTHEYYVLSHVSHVVQPGAQVVPTLSYSGFANQLAFRNPDGSLVIVVQNDLSTDLPVSFFIDGRVFAPTLPADSLSTFVLPASTGVSS